jgi:hypothetical protein
MQLIHHDGEGDPRWTRTEIPEEGLGLVCDAPGDVELVSVRERRADAWIVPFRESEGLPQAALILSPRARDFFVGGRRPAEVSLLEERSEVVLGGARLYFTARRPLEVERYEGGAVCGVCGESANGCEAIRCAQCQAVTHEGAMADGSERLCFTSRGRCPGCQLRREDFDWKPEEADA